MPQKPLGTSWRTKRRLELRSFAFCCTASDVVVLLSALYVILKPVNRILALIGALFRLVFAMLWLLATLNLLGCAATSRNRDSTFKSSNRTACKRLARLQIAREFRRLLCRSAILRIGRDCLRVSVAQVEIHSESAGDLRCDFIGMVRDLRFYFPAFSRTSTKSLTITSSIRRWPSLNSWSVFGFLFKGLQSSKNSDSTSPP